MSSPPAIIKNGIISKSDSVPNPGQVCDLKKIDAEGVAVAGNANGNSSDGDGSYDNVGVFMKKSVINTAIKSTKSKSELTLDLNDTGIDVIPDELLDLTQLQHLYMKDNLLNSLPDDFFDRLPQLQWLDLRNNRLTCLPSTYIGSHCHLKNLLLQGNRLKTLPLELGHVLTLTGLNTHDNPLQFPPQEVLDGGTKAVLAFFRAVLKAKEQHRALPVGLDEIEGYSSTPSKGSRQMSGEGHTRLIATKSSTDEIDGPDERGTRNRRAKNGEARSFTQIGSRRQMTSRREDVDRDKHELRILREKQEDAIQKHKEWTYLKEWRSNGRQLQLQKNRQRIMGRLVYSEPAEKAPYAVDKGDIKVLTNDERMAAAHQKLDKPKPRALSPHSVHTRERERARDDHSLGQRIADHEAAMQQRRQQPQSSPRTEMKLANDELRIAESLHSAIRVRRREMQHLK